MSQQTIGNRLREARESIPASLYQASRETKIRLDFLESMESDNFRFVSGGPYVKGMLRAYGRWLKLDETNLCEEFSETYGKREPSVSQMVKEPTRVPPRAKPRWLLAAGAAAAVLLLLSLIGVMTPDSKVAAPPAVPKEQQPKQSPEPATQSSDVPALGDAPAVEPAPVPGDGVRMTLTVINDQSWVEAYPDGAGALFKGMLPAGAERTFEANGQLRTVIGNLGAVRVMLNGRDLGVAGRPGQVGTFLLDPQSTSLSP